MCGATPEHGIDSSKTILIVDDEPKDLQFLEERLKVEGYLIVTVSNGEEALKLIDERTPDLVFLDMLLPGMSGLEALFEIREHYPKIPVVMTTGSWVEEEGKKAFELGAFEYITKPVNIDYVKLAILCALALEEEKHDPHPITLRGESPFAQKALGAQTIEISFFPFRIGRESRIGKARHEQRYPTSVSNNDLYFEDEPPFHISREHFQIEYRDRQYFVRDRGSKLGLYVNGRPIGGSHPEKVQMLDSGENLLVVGEEDSPYRFIVAV